MIGLNKIKEGWYSFKNAVGIGDEGENNAALNAIAKDTENRKNQIIKGAKETATLGSAAKNEFIKAGQSLSWKGDSFSKVKDDMMNKILPTNTGGLLGGSNIKTESDKKKNKKGIGKTKTDNVLSGGSKQTNIVINIDKVGTDTKIFVSSKEEGLSSFGEKLKEALLRVINSINQNQTE